MCLISLTECLQQSNFLSLRTSVFQQISLARNILYPNSCYHISNCKVNLFINISYRNFSYKIRLSTPAPARFRTNSARFCTKRKGARGGCGGGRGACGWGLLEAVVNSGRRCLFLPAKMCSKMLRRCLAGAFCAGRCWQGFGAAASFCQISLNTALRWYFPGGRGGFFAGCAAAWQNKCGCTVRRFGRGNPSCR